MAKLRITHIPTNSQWETEYCTSEEEIQVLNDLAWKASTDKMCNVKIKTSSGTIVYIPENILKDCVFQVG